jgi:hypothetical protein
LVIPVESPGAKTPKNPAHCFFTKPTAPGFGHSAYEQGYSNVMPVLKYTQCLYAKTCLFQLKAREQKTTQHISFLKDNTAWTCWKGNDGLQQLKIRFELNFKIHREVPEMEMENKKKHGSGKE